MSAESLVRTVLVVDDDRTILIIAKEILERLGVPRVECFEAAQAALDWIDSATSPPDLVVCDLNMPDLDGIELLRQLRTRKLPGCVAISTGEDERIFQTALQLVRAQGMRCAGGLRKPITIDTMRALIEEAHRLLAQLPKQAAKRVFGADELAEAIRGGRIFNVYQPQVRPSDGALEAVEALVRWAHPNEGTVFPDQFIGTAEENGLIDELAWAVMKAAFDDRRRWLEAGIAVRMAVNVSMDNLQALEFPDRLAELAKAHGMPLDALVLEITESRLMRDPVATLDILARLRLKHVRLSIDDFGTGHSSLAQLRDVPFDELKIDRGFVQGAFRSPTHRAIVEASLGMAQKLGVQTVAEGVEDAADWEFVRSRGCDLVQGYFVARPMPADRMREWADQWTNRVSELCGS